ncbi:MAG TPA: glutaminyl-peptide cyclotransferase [Thermodesulfobacteriota bacterium]|nr:glutaminyl-peptide cyclotransferase [Thermodesulfobacteriota bacterium]
MQYTSPAYSERDTRRAHRRPAGKILIPVHLLALLVLLAGHPAPGAPAKGEAPGVPAYGYEVVASYPHDPSAFTQGLLLEDGVLYESTGRRGQSSLRKVDLETGEVLRIRNLPGVYFGEGAAMAGDKIIQLTWRSQKGFVYDKHTFELLETFTYPGEGWGLTYDGRSLIMSDGTDVLRYLDPATLKETGKLEVYGENGPVKSLNELEFVEGEIFANIWGSDRIARVDPGTGRVKGWIDLSGILPEKDRKGGEDVLNGIAYDPGRKRLFVTGKLWPKLYEIRIVPAGTGKSE